MTSLTVQSLLVRTDVVGSERAQSLGVAAEFMDALLTSAQEAISSKDTRRAETLLNLMGEQVIQVAIIARGLEAEEARKWAQ